MLPTREMGTCLFQQPKAHPVSQWHTSYLGSFLNINQIGKEGLIDCHYFQLYFFKNLFLLLVYFFIFFSAFHSAFSPIRLTVVSGTVFQLGSPGFSNSEFSKLAIYRSDWVQSPLSSQHWLSSPNLFLYFLNTLILSTCQIFFSHLTLKLSS
jgi:hypothetical protein